MIKKTPCAFAMSIAAVCMFSPALAVQWDRTSGPGGGTIHALAISGPEILAGTDSGVALSSNGGRTWTKVDTESVPNTIVFAFFARGKSIFAGTFMNGIFISENNGIRWTPVNTGLPAGTTVFSFASDSNAIFAGTNNGVYRANDSGTTWTADSTGIGKKRVYSLVTRGGNAIAGTESGIFVLQKNAKKWSLDTPVISPDLLVAHGDTIIASVYRNGLFRSGDNGISWTRLATDLPLNVGISSIVVKGTALFATTISSIYTSVNNGRNWTAINSGIPSTASLFCLAVSDSVIFAGTFGMGVWRTPPLQGSIKIRKVCRPTSGGPNLSICSAGGGTQPNTAIFTLTYLENIALALCDLSGRELVSLVRGTFGPGTYSVPFDTRNFGRGCFIVRMSAGSKSISKKTANVR